MSRSVGRSVGRSAGGTVGAAVRRPSRPLRPASGWAAGRSGWWRTGRWRAGWWRSGWWRSGWWGSGPGRAGSGPSGAGVRLRPARLAAAGLWLALAAVVILNSVGSFAVDTKPEIYYAPWRSAAAYLSAWQASPQLGFPSFNVGLAPVAVAVGLIQAVGVGPALSVRVLRLLLLTIGGWGAARLYRTLRPAADRPDEVGPLVAATVFVANPYVVVAGATQAILLPWALLPWLLVSLVRGLRAAAAGARGRLGWRWPAAFALVFAAMTGMNAGVVPLFQLAAVPVVALVLRGTERIGWPVILGVVARCAALVLAVSAYWLLPSLQAVHAGAVVVDNSETLAGISGPSSVAEVVRGLGLWPLYGSGPTGPWLAQFGSYLTNPVVVAASFALPMFAVLAAVRVTGALRRLGFGLAAVAVPVMVGLFPPDHPTPFGRLLQALIDRVPAAGAFRTTNKIGALLALGVALLIAAGAVNALGGRPRHPTSRLRRNRWPPVAVGGALAAVLVAATLPAWTGNLYPSTVDLPGYWRQAAADLDRGPAGQRVWFVPGEALASYRWSQDRPDDLSTSLLRRPSLVRTVIPVTSPEAANLLAATDVGLNEGWLPPGGLSSTARYLGVGDLLLRNDVVWEYVGGGRPQVMAGQLNADPGLLPVANYGQPGQNTISPAYPPASPAEAVLPPLQHYAVAGAVPAVRTEPAAGTVLVAGDGFAVAPLVAAGLLGGEPTFRYLADLTPTDLGRLLSSDLAGGAGNSNTAGGAGNSNTAGGAGNSNTAGGAGNTNTVGVGRIVLTDTDRRRTTVPGRLGASQGPLLPAGADPGATRTLFGPDAQTVLRVDGGSVSATTVGSAFGALPYDSPENAVDGDPSTGWLFGDFGHAVGQSLTIRLATPRPVPRVAVQVRPTGGVRISRLRVQAGGVVADLTVDAAGRAVFVPPAPVTTGTVKVTVLATLGSGFNLVGIDEVQIPGVRLTRVARLPPTLDLLAAGLDAPGRAALLRTPLDVVLTRVRGPGGPGTDEETVLARDLSLPGDRTYRTYALVRPAAALSERDLDALAGATGSVTATSSSRAFDLPTVRASQALDGHPDTAWIPGSPVVGATLTITAPRRRVEAIGITQVAPGRGRLLDWATRVLVSVDGRPGVVAAVGPGTTGVRIPATTASRLAITILATHSGRPTALIRLSEVDFAGARTSFLPAAAARACVPVATVDGQRLMMRPVQPVTWDGPALWAGCGPLRLAAGAHSIRPAPGWVPDELVLRDRLGDTPVSSRQPGPRYQTTNGRGVAVTVGVTAATGPYYLVTGQAYDPRWQATLDGRDLGPPVPVDGYSTGWRIDVPGRHTIVVGYSPQRTADAALAGSIVAVLGCLLLLLLRAPPRGRLAAAAAAGRPARTSAGRHRPARGAGPCRLAGRWMAAPAGGGNASLARPVAGWLAAAALAYLLGGPLLGAVTVAVAGWHLLRRPPPRALLAAGALLLAAVPVVWLALRPDTAPVTARIVRDDLWPHRLAEVGLLLAGLGVVRAERRGSERPAGQGGPGPTGAGR